MLYLNLKFIMFIMFKMLYLIFYFIYFSYRLYAENERMPSIKATPIIVWMSVDE